MARNPLNLQGEEMRVVIPVVVPQTNRIKAIEWLTRLTARYDSKGHFFLLANPLHDRTGEHFL